MHSNRLASWVSRFRSSKREGDTICTARAPQRASSDQSTFTLKGPNNRTHNSNTPLLPIIVVKYVAISSMYVNTIEVDPRTNPDPFQQHQAS